MFLEAGEVRAGRCDRKEQAGLPVSWAAMAAEGRPRRDHEQLAGAEDDRFASFELQTERAMDHVEQVVAVDDALSPDFPLGRRARGVIRREDAERFIEEVRGDDPEEAVKAGDRGARARGGRAELGSSGDADRALNARARATSLPGSRRHLDRRLGQTPESARGPCSETAE